MSTIAGFVDRDGVINANRADHVLHWEDFQPLPGAWKGLAHLRRAGLPAIVVTNQAALARDCSAEEHPSGIHTRMVARCAQRAATSWMCLYCPHDATMLRMSKAAPGLFTLAARYWNRPRPQLFYIGDALTDVVAGQAVGCTCVLVKYRAWTHQVLREAEARHLRHYHSSASDLARARHGRSEPGGGNLPGKCRSRSLLGRFRT